MTVRTSDRETAPDATACRQAVIPASSAAWEEAGTCVSREASEGAGTASQPARIRRWSMVVGPRNKGQGRPFPNS
jgi:hypothetical protein